LDPDDAVGLDSDFDSPEDEEDSVFDSDFSDFASPLSDFESDFDSSDLGDLPFPFP
jgi:hypothetical protein